MAELNTRKWKGLAGRYGLSAEEVAFIEKALKSDGRGFADALSNRHWWPLTPRRSLEADRERLSKIAVAAADLLRLIEPEDGALLRDPSGEFDREVYERLLASLGTLQVGAKRLTEDAAGLRRSRGEDPTRKGRGRVINDSYRLSTSLISRYVATGERPSIWEGSPLHRLLTLGHRAAGLDEPSYSTIRKYVNDFKRLPR